MRLFQKKTEMLRYLKAKKYLFDRYEYIIISVILPIAWVFFEKYFRYKSRNKSFIPPSKDKFRSAMIYVHNTDIKIPAQHSLLALRSANSWARSTLKIKDVQISSNLGIFDAEVIIFTGDWFKSTKPHLKFFIPAFQLARKIKKSKAPIWFLMGDTYNLHLTIAASILVSHCGGAIILQQNTRDEALQFGIPFPSGPHIWLFSLENIFLFKSDINWNSRNNQVLFAVTGDDKRKLLLKKYEDSLNKAGWEVIPGNQQFDWNSYRDVNKKAKINITLSLLQSAANKRLRFLRDRASAFAVSLRVFEGFCSGCLVVTNINPVLSELGFIPDVHYLDVALLDNLNFVLPSDEKIERLAKLGNELFLDLIENHV